MLRNNTEHLWSLDEIAQRLYINQKSASEIISHLLNLGLITTDNQNPTLYKHLPCADELKKMIDRLAKIYAENLIELTDLIHSNTNRKAQKFANAFIWRKDP